MMLLMNALWNTTIKRKILISFYCATACNASHGIAKAFLSIRLSISPSVKRMFSNKMKETCAHIFSECELGFMFAISHRPFIRLSSVCNVRAPYSNQLQHFTTFTFHTVVQSRFLRNDEKYYIYFIDNYCCFQ